MRGASRTRPASSLATVQEPALKGRNALILVENLPVPQDRRVWPECRTLRRAGWGVTVVCPQGVERDRGRHEMRDGVDIYRFAPAYASGGVVSYLREYALALWRMGRLVRRLMRTRHFDVVHACNPPDLLPLLALPLRRRGARLIFDHHDLVPELYRTRFGRGPLLGCAHALERVAFRLSDVVLSTNESFRKVALDRGGKRPADVYVVRNGPDLEQFRLRRPDPILKRGRKHLIAYVGVMGPQDGADHAVRALGMLRERRQDWHAVFVGEGAALAETKRLAVEMGLGECAEFPGYVGDKKEITRVIATADVCLSPEPKNALNDASTMIKVAEYMAMARPVVAYDLAESRHTAGEAAAYARPNDERSFANCIETLLDDPRRRERMGKIGRERVAASLAWEHSEKSLVAAYERALRAR
jgi:glycosyltransferase involved in cell wall biosynthesis